MNSITVRPCTPADHESIRQIYKGARKKELEEVGLYDPEMRIDLCLSDSWGILTCSHIDVAVVDARVVGFCGYTSKAIEWIYVAPDKLRQKIGSTLVENALRVEPNISEVEIMAWEEPVIQFFEKCGFRDTGKIRQGMIVEDESIDLWVKCMSRVAKGN